MKGTYKMENFKDLLNQLNDDMNTLKRIIG